MARSGSLSGIDGCCAQRRFQVGCRDTIVQPERHPSCKFAGAHEIKRHGRPRTDIGIGYAGKAEQAVTAVVSRVHATSPIAAVRRKEVATPEGTRANYSAIERREFAIHGHQGPVFDVPIERRVPLRRQSLAVWLGFWRWRAGRKGLS